MKPMHYYFFIASIFVILNGCQTLGTHFKLNPVNDKEATIQILRDSVNPKSDIEIFIDGKIAASLAPFSTVTFSVPTGEHYLHFESYSGLNLKLDTMINFSERDYRYFLLEPNEQEYGNSYFSAVNYINVFAFLLRKALPDKSYLDNKAPVLLLEVSEAFAQQLVQKLKKRKTYYYGNESDSHNKDD